jgi:hypothetical protein
MGSLPRFDHAAFDASQRPYWELKNAFNPIYTAVQKALRKYNSDDWKPLSDSMRLPIIDASNGDPLTTYTGDQREIDVGRFYGLLELHFGAPNLEDCIVTCEQWQKFVKINNTFATIFCSIEMYERMRKKMANPEKYLAISFRSPIPLIGNAKYRAIIKKCVDYTPATEYALSIKYL